MGIVSRVLADRLIARLERTKLLAGHLEFTPILQFHETTSITPLGLKRRSEAKMVPTSSSQPSCRADVDVETRAILRSDPFPCSRLDRVDGDRFRSTSCGLDAGTSSDRLIPVPQAKASY